MGNYKKPEPIDSDLETTNSTEFQRLQHRVELQSMQIEKVLAKHQVNTGIIGGTIRSDWIDFNLQDKLSNGWGIIRRLTDDLVAYLNVPEVKIERQHGSFRILVKKEVTHAVDLLDLNDAYSEFSGVGVTLGISEDGQPILLNLSSPDISNVLVTGVDGAGKTGLLRTFAISLALSNRQSEVQIGVIAAGNGSRSLVTQPNPLYPLNYLPHLLFPVVTSVQDAIPALEFLVEEINYRLEANLNTPLIVLLIDDVDWLLSRGGQLVYESFAELLHTPADVGFRTIISATEINLGGLSRLLKYDTPMRFVGRVENSDQAFYLTGELDTGAEFLNGRGDFLAVTYGNQIHFQAAYIDDYDLHLTLGKLYRPTRGVLLARQQDRNGLNGILEASNSHLKFTYDSNNGRATIEEQADISKYQAPAVILERAGSHQVFDHVVDDQTRLSAQGKETNINIDEHDLPSPKKLARETSNELPGFLNPISSSQFEMKADEQDKDLDLGDKGQLELEYSELEDEIDYDFDEVDEWQPSKPKDPDDSELDSNRFH